MVISSLPGIDGATFIIFLPRTVKISQECEVFIRRGDWGALRAPGVIRIDFRGE